MSDFNSKPEGFFDGEKPLEQVAAGKQAEVDADITTSQETSLRLTELREIGETKDRMTKVFNLVARLMAKKERNQADFNFQVDGKSFVLEISDFIKIARKEGYGTNAKDSVRLLINEIVDDKQRTKYDLVIKRKFGKQDFEVQYRDHVYEETTEMGPNPLDASEQIPRKKIKHHDSIRFPQRYANTGILILMQKLL